MSETQHDDSEDTEEIYEQEFSYYKLWVMAACFSIIASAIFYWTYPEARAGLATFPPGALFIGFILWIISIIAKFFSKPIPLLRFSGILLVMIGICTFFIIAVLTLTPIGAIFGMTFIDT